MEDAGAITRPAVREFEVVSAPPAPPEAPAVVPGVGAASDVGSLLVPTAVSARLLVLTLWLLERRNVCA